MVLTLIFVILILIWLCLELALLLQAFYVIKEGCCGFNELRHAFHLSIPIRVVDELKEDVENAPFNLLSITQWVQGVPELHEELFLSSLTLLFLYLKGALCGASGSSGCLWTLSRLDE